MSTATLYEEKGYAETTIGDVVAHARVSRRTVYEHFRSIEGLRFALYECAIGETLLAVGELDLGSAVNDRMRLALTTLFARIRKNPGLARAALYEFRLPRRENIALRRRVLEFFGGVLMHGLDEAFRTGYCPTAPDELTVYGMMGAIEGVIAHVIEEPPTESRWDAALDACLRVYSGVYRFLPERAR